LPANGPNVRIRLHSGEYVFDCEEEVTIGRAEDARLQLHELSTSRAHAVLQFIGGRWVFLDVGSSQGSFVNGRPIGRLDITKATTLRLGHPEHGEVLEIVPEPVKGPESDGPTEGAPPAGGADAPAAAAAAPAGEAEAAAAPAGEEAAAAPAGEAEASSSPGAGPDETPAPGGEADETSPPAGGPAQPA